MLPIPTSTESVIIPIFVSSQATQKYPSWPQSDPQLFCISHAPVEVTPLTVTTSTAGQNARYTFSGTAGQTATVSLTNSTYTGCAGLNVSILKPDGTSLSSAGLCGASGTVGPSSLPTTGTYTVLVNPAGAATGSVTVTLSLN